MALAWETLAEGVLQQILGYAIGGAITPALAPLTQDFQNKAWIDTGLLVVPVSPADLAAMVVQGYLDQTTAEGKAALSGISPDNFDLLVKVNGSPIAPEQALDLWNRGELTEARVDDAIRQSRLKPEWLDTFKLLAVQIPQVADLAEMVVQSVISPAEGEQGAAKLGWSPADFDRLVLLAGSPPGPDAMLQLWNRGQATEDDVNLALAQSRLKPQWIPAFKQLRIHPASTAQAAEAVIKQRITAEAGAAIAAENGTDAATFAMIVDAGGRPIATGEALTLYRRGEFTEAQVIEAIDRSDVRSEYAPDILKLATVYPGLYQVKQMLATGALSDADARQILKYEGYTPAVIDALVAAGHGVKLAAQKQLTLAAILDLYKAREITEAEAGQMLDGLGYDQADQALLLGLADYQAAKEIRSAAVAIVKGRYLKHAIDETKARAELATYGIPTDAAERYLELWSFDLAESPKLLTLAECNALVKKQTWTATDYKAYLPRLGYVEPELGLLVALYASG